MYRNSMLRKMLAVMMLVFCLVSLPSISFAASKKRAPSKKASTPKAVSFDLDKFIQAHRNNNRNAIHEQLAALKGNFRRTFTLQGVSQVNLLMFACYWAADTNSMDAIYTLIDNCPDLINARDSRGQTAIFYSLQNNYTLPFEVLLNDKRTQVNIQSKSGFSPIQALVSIWGAQYQNEGEAIMIMLNRGASLVTPGGGLTSAFNIMVEKKDPNVSTFRPIAERQYQESLSKQRR